MTDRVLLGASLRTFDDCLRLARQYGVGLELQAFAYPEVLDNGWEDLIERYKRALLNPPGELAMHGPFLDMSSGTPDPLIRAVVLARINHAIEIADRLQIPTIVFHANFIASIRNLAYRVEWSHHEVEFWSPLAERARHLGIILALENMWEFDPYIIRDVVEQINSPSLMACLDVGHAALFSDLPLSNWLDALAPFLVHLHLNNNLGQIDEHLALDNGVLDYTSILPVLRELPRRPAFSLEIAEVDALRRSLPFLKLPEPVPNSN